MTFSDLVLDLAPPYAARDAVQLALKLLGPLASQRPSELPPSERMTVIDRFVRNLRGLGTHESTELQRTLMLRADAAPTERFSRALDSSQAVLEVRNHLRLVLTSLGLSWEESSRVQAAVSGVCRWLLEGGQASVVILPGAQRAHFEVRTGRPWPLHDTIAHSPMVETLRQHVALLSLTERDASICLLFDVLAP